MYYEDDFMIYWIVYIIFALIVGIVFGFVCRAIVRNKGYDAADNHGFAWGFWLGIIGLIVCASKSECNYSYGYSKPLFPVEEKPVDKLEDTTSIVRELENLQKMKEMKLISDENFDKKETELKNLYSKTIKNTNNKRYNAVKSKQFSWLCPECKRTNPSGQTRCYCGYSKK
jgi:hypothetical protein